MKTNDFFTPISSAKLNESFEKQFGSRVNLENYSRVELEDMRNKLRTRVFQQEGGAGYNDLLTNEAYQKDQALLQLLNTRIKEMLGENLKKLRDKMNELSEAKAPAKKAKPDFLDLDKDGDTKEPMKKAAKEKKFKEGFDDMEKARKEKEKPQPNGGAGKKPGKAYEESVKEAAKPSAGLTAKEKSAVVKKAKAGKDIGKAGKGFEKVEKAAAKGGAKDPKAVAAAAMWKGQAAKKKGVKESQFKHNVNFVNESLQFLLNEDEEGKAKTITAAGDMVNDFTSWMQRVGQYQTKSMIELSDAIRADFGQAEAEAFKQAVAPALSMTLDTLTQQREAVSNAVAALAGEAVPEEPMGMEPGMDDMGEMPPEPGMDASEPDMMHPEPAGDEFGASDAAAGMGTTGREMRESKFSRKLAESHSIMTKLAK